MAKDWENRKDRFEVVDVRKLTGNFLPGLLNKVNWGRTTVNAW